MTKRLPSFADAKTAAAGRWPGILIAAGLAPEALTGKHRPCPGCGGRDRFRFIDKQGDGYFICGRGGDPLAGDGFALLQHALVMTPAESLRFVADYLGLEGREISQADHNKYRQRQILEALAFELQVAGIAVADRLAGKPLSPKDTERERLAAERITNGMEMLHGG